MSETTMSDNLLVEKIARLINPEAWETVDYLRELGVAVGPRHRTSAGSLAAARRVIDGTDILRDYDTREDL